jgi:hypothetical protein
MMTEKERVAIMAHWCKQCANVVESKATFGGKDSKGRKVIAVWTDKVGHTIVIQ